MLTIIGSSRRPLSSYEIKKRTQGASYAYRMLSALTGIPQEPFNGILSEPRFRRRNREANERWQREYRLRIERASRGPRFLQIHTDEKDEDNRRKWRYSLNFRGFLLYLIGESQDRRRERRRVRQVLSNPRTIEIAPFLRYWADFERVGFDVIGTLLTISREFQDQLGYDEDYLLPRVSERYFNAFANFFDRFQSAVAFHLYAKKVDLDTDRKIREYCLAALRQHRAFPEAEIARVERWINIYTEVA